MSKLGEGSFGTVCKMVEKGSGSFVAVKRLAETFETFSSAVNLREVQCLMLLDHPNIVRLLQVIRENVRLKIRKKENSRFF